MQKIKVRKNKQGYLQQSMNEVERKIITDAFEKNHSNQVKTAEFLGINRNTLRSRLVEYGLATIEDLTVETPTT